MPDSEECLTVEELERQAREAVRKDVEKHGLDQYEIPGGDLDCEHITELIFPFVDAISDDGILEMTQHWPELAERGRDWLDSFDEASRAEKLRWRPVRQPGPRSRRGASQDQVRARQ